MIDKLFRESGTAGIRIQETNRIVLPRDIITLPIIINKCKFDIRVKIIKDINGDILNTKPEYDDLQNISKKMNMSYKSVYDLTIPQISSNITIGE